MTTNAEVMSDADLLLLGDLIRRGIKSGQVSVSIDRPEGPTFTIRNVDVVLEGDAEDSHNPRPTVDIFI